ncbi:hypothetical protein MFIFM68171_10138 [Madurella fahalii]|uniref:Uncharacterized protein n=1 Tax=Madurella fahalii TaxID=1157608 RepID=A0ABQ0GQA8_9PEZI
MSFANSTVQGRFDHQAVPDSAIDPALMDPEGLSEAGRPAASHTSDLEAQYPSVFYEPSRENLVKLLDKPPPRLRRSKAANRVVPADVGMKARNKNVAEGSAAQAGEGEGDVDATPGRLLSGLTLTREESGLLDGAHRIMLFIWNNVDFSGYYARRVSTNTPTGSERFLQIRAMVRRRFHASKTRFFWLHAYSWAVEVAIANPEYVAWALDGGDDATEKLNAALLPLLDADVFRQFFFHVRDIVDFDTTMQQKPQGKYWITSIFLSLTTMFFILWSSEQELNSAAMHTTDGKAQGKGKAKGAEAGDADNGHHGWENKPRGVSRPSHAGWRQDKAYRHKIAADFSNWGYMVENFRHVGLGSFAYIDRNAKSAKSAKSIKSVKSVNGPKPSRRTRPENAMEAAKKSLRVASIPLLLYIPRASGLRL